MSPFFVLVRISIDNPYNNLITKKSQQQYFRQLAAMRL
jgi:hypothetical protein